MALPDSYTQKPGSIPDYFSAILDAQAPERFSQKFLENLGFKSTNDRLFIGILKELGFIDADGVPTERYYRFHDRTQWEAVLSEGIQEAYSDLFAINQKAYELSAEEVTNKLRTLYAGKKTDQVIGRIARTFTALCELADFKRGASLKSAPTGEELPSHTGNGDSTTNRVVPSISQTPFQQPAALSVSGLQYHINIVLPDSRDQAVYDAIFKSLRDHLR